MVALQACVERIEDEGLETVIGRHTRAAAATRAGVKALGGGFAPYVREARHAAPVATTLRAPEGVDASELVARALAADPVLPLVAGGGALAKEMIRVNHYGTAAAGSTVHSCLSALGAALTDLTGRSVDPEAARRAAIAAWERPRADLRPHRPRRAVRCAAHAERGAARRAFPFPGTPKSAPPSARTANHILNR